MVKLRQTFCLGETDTYLPSRPAVRQTPNSMGAIRIQLRGKKALRPVGNGDLK